MDRRQLLVRAAAAFGTALAAPILTAVQAGADPGRMTENSTFNDHQREMMTRIVDMIIPRTDTPGAIDAGVPQFVEMIVSDWYHNGQRSFFFESLRVIDNHCLSSFGKVFLECSQAQQILALEDAEANALGAISDGVPGPSGTDGAIQVGDPAMWGDARSDAGARFFNEIKGLTVLGYYTSEIGVEAELIYDPVPGKYDGNVDFASIGKHYTS